MSLLIAGLDGHDGATPGQPPVKASPGGADDLQGVRIGVHLDIRQGLAAGGLEAAHRLLKREEKVTQKSLSPIRRLAKHKFTPRPVPASSHAGANAVNFK